MLRIALRQHVGGFLAVTALASLAGVAVAAGFSAIGGQSPQERAALAAQMEILGRQLSFLLPIPVQLDTVGGFLQWRHFGNLPLVYGAWGLLAATGAARGDEDRGLVEQWLAAGVSRARYLAARAFAFALAVTASVALMLAATSAGAALGGESVAAGALAQQGMAVISLALCCFAIGLVVSQLAGTGRGAAGIGAVALLGLFLVNSLGRTTEALHGLQPLSPFFHYDRTDALLRDGGLDVTSTAVLLGAFALLWLAAVRLFQVRDHGGTALGSRAEVRRAVHVPSRDPLLRLPVLAALDQQRLGLLAWAGALSAVAVFLVSMVPTMVELAAEVPMIRLVLMRQSGADIEAAFLGTVWGSAALLLLSVYAITQVAAWSAEDSDGRLEMTLSAPVPRWRVALERGAQLTLGAAIVVLISGVAVWASVRVHDLDVGAADVARASALLVPFTVAIGAIGAAIAGWRPRLAVWILATLVVLSYFIQQLAPLFRWPEWVRDLSLFELYGSPLASGTSWTGLSILLALIVLGQALAVVSLERRDVGR